MGRRRRDVEAATGWGCGGGDGMDHGGGDGMDHCGGDGMDHGGGDGTATGWSTAKGGGVWRRGRWEGGK
jgi:hypothetical protein